MSKPPKSRPTKKMLRHFLGLFPTNGWRDCPPVWNKELRAALSDNLVTVGWGGVLMLTEAGKKFRNGQEVDKIK